MIHVPPGDRRQCQAIILSNGLRCLLISDPDAEQAGASMSVGAGSIQEPPEFPGLAHLLEHLLFLGTEKYPSPEDFPRFILGSGGRYNANTELDQTLYFFEIPEENLIGALERFAQFFIAPSLSDSAIVQERKVIEAEYRARLADDEQCILGVIKQVLNPAHPASRFFAGNRDTLGAASAVLRRALVAFCKRYYMATNLQLVVIARASLEVLEEAVREYFVLVPAGTNPEPVAFPPLLLPDSLPRWLALQPSRPCHELRLCFPVPALEPDDFQQPWDYLGKLLSFRGAGSLQRRFIDRGWLTAIDSSVLLETRPQALFQIRLQITLAGRKHIGVITATVFAYLQRIVADGIDAWRHRERQILAEQHFRWETKASTIVQVKMLACQLHRYPVGEALRGPYRLDSFRPEVVRYCLAHLTTDNLLAIVIDPATRSERETPWFPVSFRLTEPPLIKVTITDGACDVSLPPSNPFFMATPTDARVSWTSSMPTMLHDSGRCRFWYQPFKAPGARANMYLNLVLVRSLDTPRGLVLMELLIAWLEQELAGELQQARSAGLEVVLERYHQGMTLKASGFPASLERLLPRLVHSLAHKPITELRFDQSRQVLQARWEMQQHDYAFRRLLELPAVLLGHNFSEEECLAELTKTAVESLEVFRDEWLDRAGLDCLIAGQLELSQAQRIATILEQNLPGTDPSLVLRLPPSSMPLTDSESCQYQIASSHTDSAVALYLPAHDASPNQQVCYRLLAALLHDVFYQRLRVEEQLGYVVMVRYLPVYTRPGLILLVQSPSHSVTELKQRICHFLTASDAPPLVSDAESFEHYRKGLLQAIGGQLRLPVQRTEQFWAGLTKGNTALHCPSHAMQAVAALTLEELQWCYQTKLLYSTWVWLHT